MNNVVLANSFRFVLLVVLQVVLFNQIYLFGHINPIIYIIFIFYYPLKKEKGLFLIIAFLLGLCVDFFSNSGGVNAAATVLIAYIRLPLLHIILNKPEFDYILFNVKKLNFSQAIIYIFSLTLIHHLVVFILEFYKTSGFISILTSVLITTVVSGTIIGFTLQLFTKNKKN